MLLIAYVCCYFDTVSSELQKNSNHLKATCIYLLFFFFFNITGRGLHDLGQFLDYDAFDVVKASM